MLWARLLLLVALRGYELNAEPVSICTSSSDNTKCFGTRQNLTKVTSAPAFQTICTGYDATARTTLDVQFVDWNNDVFVDVVLRSGDGPFRYFENDLMGSFVEKTGSDNPFDGIQPAGLPSSGGGFGGFGGGSASPGFSVADWDGDGYKDILIGGVGNTTHLWQNDGSGNLVESANSSMVIQLALGNPKKGEQGRRFQAVDWDYDGDLDLIVAEVYQVDLNEYASSVARYFERASPSVLQEMTGEDSPFNDISLGSRNHFTAGDWDADQDIDLVVISDGEEIIYYNRNGAGRIARRDGISSPFNPLGLLSTDSWRMRDLPTRHIHMVDLVGDSQKDLLFFDCEKTIILERLSDNRPVELVGISNPLNDLVVHQQGMPQFFDLNRDGYADILVQSTEKGWSNPGGTPHVQYFRAIPPSSSSSAFNSYEEVAADASPLTNIPDILNVNTRFFAVDWDADGWPDLVVRNPSAELLLYNGSGYESFSTTGQQLGITMGNNQDPITSFQVVDWDGDGDLDILWVGGQAPTGGELKLLVNSGSGFSDSTLTYTGNTMGTVASFDALKWNTWDSQLSLLVVKGKTLELWARESDGSLSYQPYNDLAGWSPELEARDGTFASVTGLQVRGVRLDSSSMDSSSLSIIAGSHDDLYGGHFRMRLWKFGHCLPDTACSQAGICNQLAGTCICLEGRDENDCSGCASGYYSSSTVIIGEVPLCLSCPRDSSTNQVCSARGKCMDDKQARASLSTASATRRANAMGTGNCTCSEYYYGSNSQGLDTCTAGECPAGKAPHTTDEGIIVCQTCTWGTGKDDSGNHECYQCNPGYAYKQDESGFCEACPAGKYTSYSGSSYCDDCLQNMISSAGSVECRACHAGSVKTGPDQCTDCPAGKAPQSDGLDYQCIECEGGRAPEQGVCTACTAGRYSDSGDPQCFECPAGRYSNQVRTWGLAGCQYCPAGRFYESNGSQSVDWCTACDPGSTTADWGQTSKASCILPDTNQNFTCEAGKFCKITGLNGTGLGGSPHGQVAILNGPCSHQLKIPGVPNDGMSSFTSANGTTFEWHSQFTSFGGTYSICWCANLNDQICDGLASFQISVGFLTVQGPYETSSSLLTFVRAKNTTIVGPVDGVDLLPTDSLLVSPNCWMSQSFEGLTFPSRDAVSESGGKLSVTYSEFYPPPGQYELCWGRNADGGFAASAGTVTVHGPPDGQSAACFNGQHCSVDNLQGSSLAYGDQLMPSADCVNPVDDMPLGGIYTTTEGFDWAAGWWKFGYNNEVMNVRTGVYKLCWRRPPHQLWINIGFFEVKGPQGDLIVDCEVGKSCEISMQAGQPFRGLGLVVGDAIKIRDGACTSPDGGGEMAYRKLPLWDGIAYSTTGEKGTFDFNLGPLPADGHPGTYSVCWCAQTSSTGCWTAEHFKATAGIVDVKCPLGTYAAGLYEDTCAECPRGAYCPGGLPAFARKNLCDFGQTTATTGASNKTSCKCQPGFEYNTKQDVCEQCARGRYKSTVSSTDTCQLCAEGVTTFSEGSTDVAACAVPLKGSGQPPSKRNVTNTTQVFAVTTIITLSDYQLADLGGDTWFQMESDILIAVARTTGNTPGQIMIEFLNQPQEQGDGQGGNQPPGGNQPQGARRMRRMSGNAAVVDTVPGKKTPKRRMTSSGNASNTSNPGPSSPQLRIVINTRSEQEAQASSADMGTTAFLLEMAATTQSNVVVESNATVELATVTCSAFRSVPPGVSIVSADECECSAGYGVPSNAFDCNPCPKGEYKSDVGSVSCSKCASLKSTLQEASTDETQCICQAGTYQNSRGECDNCEQGYYCDGTGMGLQQCPPNSNTSVGVRAVYKLDCLCLPGYFLDENQTCSPCERGRYKPQIGNGQCSLSCPQNAVTEPGATSNYDCFCIPGTYASTSPNNELIACQNCPPAGLTCRGGFEGQQSAPQNAQPNTGGNASSSGRRLSSTARVHALPVARAGYFQTGVTTAVQCKITNKAGESQCQGGSECVATRIGQEVPAGVTCYGEFGTACREGSSGMLCGQCPPGWSRDAYPDRCEACGGNAWTSTILSVLVELGTQACIVLTVASMAATSSGTGGSLHSALIRIFSQWLAACSVITNFDLEKISGFSWAKRAAQMDLLASCNEGATCQNMEAQALFQWPPQLTNFMSHLFGFAGIFPSVGSTQEMLECLVEDHDDTTEGKMFIPALFYLAYPLLLGLMSLFVCAIFVYLCVPILKRMGMPLSIDLVKETGKAVARRSAHIVLSHMTVKLAEWGLDLDEVEEALGDGVDPAAIEAILEDPGQAIQLMFEMCKPLAAKMFAFKFWPVLEDPMTEQGMTRADLCQFALTFAAADELTDNMDIIGRNPLVMANIIHAANIKAASERFGEQDELPSLIIGLFSERPGPCKFISQCAPVLWLALHQMWPFLLKKFLMMIWCSPVLLETSGQLVVEQRLLPNPDVQCFTRDHWKLALCALVGLGAWCVGGPLIIFLRIRSLGNEKYAPENAATFGYFLKGYEPAWWYWDVVVKRLDVGMMMVVTYTSITDDDKARLLLYPFISGLALAITSWAKPFDDRQANLLDFMESLALTVRFILFSVIAVLLIFNAGLGTTIAMGIFVCISSAFFGVAMLLHVAAQYSQREEDEEEDEDIEEDEGEEREQDQSQGELAAGSADSVRGIIMNKAISCFKSCFIALVIAAVFKAVQVLWAQDNSEKVRVLLEKKATVARVGFKFEEERTEAKKEGRIKRALKSFRAGFFRNSEDYQRTAIVIAMGQFHSLWLTHFSEENLTLDGRILCILALASKGVSKKTRSDNVLPMWKKLALRFTEEALKEDGKPYPFSADDVYAMTMRFQRLHKEEATDLIQTVQQALDKEKVLRNEPMVTTI